MKYERPRLVDLVSFATAQGSCENGSRPTYGVCLCLAGASQAHSGGAGCNPGCTAANHCNNGTDAGFTGKPQGCKSGAAAMQNTNGDGCLTGYGVTTTPGEYGGCWNGYSAYGCNTGSHRYIGCIAGSTDV